MLAFFVTDDTWICIDIAEQLVGVFQYSALAWGMRCLSLSGVLVCRIARTLVFFKFLLGAG